MPAPRKPARKTALPAFTPVPRKCPRHDGWTPERQTGFIEALADYGSVRAAANAMGMTPESAYQLRRQPGSTGFRKAWEAALDLGMQRVEDVAMDRALNGVEVPVYSYGKLLGTRTVHNDRLLMFMLRNRAPERFAEGSAKAMNAVDGAQVRKLKAQWRREWEEEKKRANSYEREDQILDGIDKKLERMRINFLTYMSPRTRAAYDEYERLMAEDKEAGYDPFTDPEHELYVDRGDQRLAEGPIPQPELRWQDYEDDEPAAVEARRVRTVKDDGWE